METQRLLFVWLVTAVLTIFCGACEAQQLTCETGPVTKTYGGTNWLIYSCSDHQSLALLSEPNSLASPFMFFFHRMDDGHYRLSGEGTGNRSATDAALKELSALSQSQIEAVLAATRPQ
jgi:hypothetical protein